RVSVKTADNKVELGVTGVSEGTGDGSNKLTGADLRVQVTPTTQLKAEVAHTDNGPNGGISSANAAGNAYSLDLKTESQALHNDIYVKNESSGFGLGQQSLGDAGMLRIGDDTKYNLDKNWAITADLMHQK